MLNKSLSVTVSEYNWTYFSESRTLYCQDSRDGEQMFVVTDLVEEPGDSAKKQLLNVFLSGFYKGSRHGQYRKTEEIKKALNI